MAREAGLAITHIFETHIHADLVSGSHELCARLESAKIYSSGEAGLNTALQPEKIGWRSFHVWVKCLSRRGIPGHTPEHILIYWPKQRHPDEPWAVLLEIPFSFHRPVGRNLLGEKHTKQLAEQQFHTCATSI